MNLGLPEANGKKRSGIGNFLPSFAVGLRRISSALGLESSRKRSFQMYGSLRVFDGNDIPIRVGDNVASHDNYQDGPDVVLRRADRDLAARLEGDLYKIPRDDGYGESSITFTNDGFFRAFMYDPFYKTTIIPKHLISDAPQLLDSALVHELTHHEHLILDQQKQMELADLFLENTDLQVAMIEFARALYSPEESSYFKNHLMQNIQSTVATDEAGVKDPRSLEIIINGKKQEFSLTLLMTELVAYLGEFRASEGIRRTLTHKSTLVSSGDDSFLNGIYGATSKIFEILENNTELSGKFAKLIPRPDLNEIRNVRRRVSEGIEKGNA